MAAVRRFWKRVNDALVAVGFTREWFLVPLAAVVGVLGGVLAVSLEHLVEGAGEFFYGPWMMSLGGGDADYLRLLILLSLPAMGGLAVGLLHRYVFHAEGQHGVPQVVEAMAKHEGRMRARSGLSMMVCSSLTIGSGGSAGVEGPIVSIGSVLGSKIAEFLGIGREHVHTLIGCGAAAGIGGIFNSPIAAVLFVLEVVLRDFSFKTFIPVVIAAVFGTVTGQALTSEADALFLVHTELRAYQVSWLEVGPYAVLGVLCGLVGVLFAGMLRRSEAAWRRVPGPRWLHPAWGGLLLGVVGVLFLMTSWMVVPGRIVESREPPPFYGNGYPVVRAMLNPVSYKGGEDAAPRHTGGTPVPPGEDTGGTPVPPSVPPPMSPSREAGDGDVAPLLKASVPVLLLLLASKAIGTCITLGSGGAGGIIAPSLFMGAALGGGFGLLMQRLGVTPDATPAAYALTGMAGVIAATIHCPLTAFILVFEVTQDYQIILPTMLVAMLATTSSQLINRDSIYNSWLRKHGVRVGAFSDMTLLRRIRVGDVPIAPAVTVEAEEPASRLVELAQDYAASDYVVADADGRYLGMVVGEDVRAALVEREALPLMIVAELMRTELPTVSRGDPMDAVMDKFSRHDVSSLAVVDKDEKVRGVMTRSRLIRQYQQALEAG